jgi:thiamine biosynthesis protein ThiS
MHVTINGEAKQLSLGAGPTTVAALLVHLALPAERVAVELNGVVIRRADRADRAVVDGDVLEIVTLVGGG